MQCALIASKDGPGLYTALDDSAGFRKHLDVYGDGRGGVGIQFSHYVETYQPESGIFSLPYRVIVGTIEGDWFDAATRYRDWAIEQDWARNSRLKSGLVPQWVQDTGIWVWNRGRSENVLPPTKALQTHTKLPVNVFWHWWHGCPYDVGFPEYLPPREGSDTFRSALADAHSQGVHAMVYMNQRLWGMTTKSWAANGAERFAVKDQQQNIRPEIYNSFTKSPNASMCIGTAFWRDTYSEIARTAYDDLGIDAIYMDQACSSLACFDPNHGHPLGGGRFWMDGFRTLSSDIRDRCTSRGTIALAGEGCGEAWLPYLDLMLSLQVSMERYANPGDWEPIPFFHAVYHGYALFYGNYSSLTMPPYDELWPVEFAPKNPLALLDTKYARQFRMEHARAFVWGQQPTVANFRPEHLESRADDMQFIVDLARLRVQALKYLAYGTMIRTPPFDAPIDTIDMSRLSIYAGQQDALKEYRKSYPLVYAAAWKAADGDLALTIANVDDKDHEVQFKIPTSEWGIGNGWTVLRTDHTGRDQITTWNEDSRELDYSLPPRYTCIIEFSAD
ncbi:MAG: hypothetical protein AMXMBFR84_21910 [Candidatus Hydrogenedentota bacterium]